MTTIKGECAGCGLVGSAHALDRHIIHCEKYAARFKNDPLNAPRPRDFYLEHGGKKIEEVSCRREL